MAVPTTSIKSGRVGEGSAGWAREIGQRSLVALDQERSSQTVAKLSLALWAAAVVVIALGVAREVFLATVGEGTFLQEWRHFDLDREGNLPTWFSSGTMLLIAGLAGLLAAVETSSRAVRRGWVMIAGVFVLLSLDEASSFHEALMDPLRDWLGVSGVFHYAWIVPAVPFLLLFGFWTLRLLRTLPRSLRFKMALAGVLFVTGAVGMEMIGGMFVADGVERGALVYRIEIMAEETFEIAGLVLFATALMSYAASSGTRLVRRPEAS